MATTHGRAVLTSVATLRETFAKELESMSPLKERGLR